MVEGEVQFHTYCRKHTLLNELGKDIPFGIKELSTQQQTKLKSTISNSDNLINNLSISTLILAFKYWLIRRKRHPTPLLRRLQVDSDQEQYKRLRRLRQNMEKARILLDLVRKREHLKRDHAVLLGDVFEEQMSQLTAQREFEKEQTLKKTKLLELKKTKDLPKVISKIQETKHMERKQKPSKRKMSPEAARATVLERPQNTINRSRKKSSENEEAEIAFTKKYKRRRHA